MSDTIRMPDPDPDKGNGGLDMTSRKPGSFAEGGDTVKQGGSATGPEGTLIVGSNQGIPEAPPSSNASATVKKPGVGSSSSKGSIDELPQEAQQYNEDPARQLNQYILVKQIGKGGMGTVWKAWDRRLTRWVAIKFLLVSEDEDIARFQREAKLAARLRHPNIAPIYEVGEAPAQAIGQSTRHYLAMEYIDGMTMAAATGFPLRELLDIFVKVAQGVEAAHKAGVVHRDLKPQNVMLTTDKWPYVMDFGLAKALQTESSLSVSGAVMGTPAYMPPEQAQGQLDEIDARSDVYSLGATMYAVLCKKQPFTGQTPMEILMKVCKDDPPPPRSLNAEIPEEVEKIILKSLAKAKEHRYESSHALAEDLKRFLANQQVQAEVPPPARKKDETGKKPPVALFAVAGAVVLGIAGFFIFKPDAKPVVPPIPPIVPTPPTVATNPDSAAGKKSLEWLQAWNDVRPLLRFDAWKAGDATLADRASKLLGRQSEDAPEESSPVLRWFTDETDQAVDAAQNLRGSADEKKAAASKIVGWCDTVAAAGKGVDLLKRPLETAGRARAAAAAVADYKGSFTLTIFVAPYAEVTRLTRNGKDVPLAQRLTPLAVSGLEVGDIEVELSHPQLGKKVEKISAAQLKDGKKVLISGRMQDVKLKVGE